MNSAFETLNVHARAIRLVGFLYAILLISLSPSSQKWEDRKNVFSVAQGFSSTFSVLSIAFQSCHSQRRLGSSKGEAVGRGALYPNMVMMLGRALAFHNPFPLIFLMTGARKVLQPTLRRWHLWFK